MDNLDNLDNLENTGTQFSPTNRPNPPGTEPGPGFADLVRNSQFLRILLVGFLVLLLQIPTSMVQNLVSERQNVRQEAIAGITSTWGHEQSLVGPQLTVPYIKRFKVGKEMQAKTLNGTFLPKDLAITGQLDPIVKHRGIFEVPVYTLKAELKGQFEKPDFSSWGVQPEDILWDRAELSVGISDVKAIQNQAEVTWNEAKVPFAPGIGKLSTDQTGIHAVLNGKMKGDRFAFSIPLTLKGSEKFRVTPMGEVTKVSLQSPWSNPSFQGAWATLDSTKVTDKGFDAQWEVASLGRGFPQSWNAESPVGRDRIEQTKFGVDLISPVDNYRMADRSVKYNVLFILLTFLTFWFFELTTKLRVHPLQYLLVGGAMCMFYLLQLALSEHMGYHLAYALASAAVVVLITAYSFGVLQAKKRGGVIGVMEVMLYSYLYVVLANQDYSLLIGSLGMFVFLAVAMFFTRRLNREGA
jgi:inner membrane protein